MNFDINNLKEKADKGDVSAQCQLGICYLNGNGVEEDNNKAYSLFKRSAEKGNLEAQAYLGYCAYYGIGRKSDEDDARALCKKPAKKGNAMAQYIMGETCKFLDSDSFLKTAVKAKEKEGWLLKAAGQGYDDAFDSLGWFYAGEGKEDKEDTRN